MGCNVLRGVVFAESLPANRSGHLGDMMEGQAGAHVFASRARVSCLGRASVGAARRFVPTARRARPVAVTIFCLLLLCWSAHPLRASSLDVRP